MTTFTELLDEYLDAKAKHDEARARFGGYDFDYFHHKEAQHLHDARAALNIAFIQASAGTPATSGSLL